VPIDITPHLEPARCAVVNMECQENLIGESSVLPGLANAAAEVGLVANCATLFDAARRVGTRIYYCLDTASPRRLRARQQPTRAQANGERLGA
jgi:hypothetical protein